jgi:di/tricarboxylate transporter
MIQEHLPRIIQSIIALPLLILTISHWNDNQIGQNLINLSATATFVIGLDYIIIIYRWLMNHQESFHYELTIIFGMLYLIGKLFEKFHPSENEIPFNKICEYNLIGIISVNLAFVIFILIVLIIYAIRQIYRLMTETLLSTNQNLE